MAGWRFLCRRSGVLLLVCLTMAGLPPIAVAGDAIHDQLLDPATGEIDGETALAIYPLRYEGRKAKEVLDTAGCSAYLKSRTDFDVFVHPCGEWVQVPPDAYDYWVEKGWQVSPFTRKLVFAGGEFRGQGMVGGMPLGPAGRVVMPKGYRLSPDLELRIIHAETPEVDGLLRGAISRRLPLAEMTDGIQMPAGTTLALVWDRRARRHVMFARPFETVHREVVVPPFEEPDSERSYVVAQIVRHEKALRVEDDDVKLSLVVDGVEKAPSFQFGTAERVYGQWFDLEPGSAELHAESEGAVLDPLAVDLRPGAVSRASGQMIPRPTGPDLQVDVDLPAALADDEIELVLRELPAGETMRTRTLGPGQFTWSFGDLPAAVVEVELQTPLGPVSEVVDLTSGADDYVRLAPELIVTRGEVLLGDETHPAEIRFTTVSREELSVATDVDGFYELVSIEPLRAASVKLEEVEREPFVEIFFDAITQSGRLDFEIPDNLFRVRVVDARSGSPVPEARVVSKNYYERATREVAEAKKKAVSQRVVTDDEGMARLAPLRPGRVEISVSAEGWADPDESVRVEVPDDAGERTVEIALEPVGGTAEIGFRLPDGRPAEGARITVMSRGGAVLSESVTDAEGRAEVPEDPPPGATVLARHPSSAFLIRPLPRPIDGDETWTFEPAVDPLTLRVLDQWGESPIPHARIGLWVGDAYLSERVLYRLTGTRPLADGTGHWKVRNLPAQPISVVSWRSGSEHGAESAELSSLAIRLDPPPWPGVVEVRAITD